MPTLPIGAEGAPAARRLERKARLAHPQLPTASCALPAQPPARLAAPVGRVCPLPLCGAVGRHGGRGSVCGRGTEAHERAAEGLTRHAARDVAEWVGAPVRAVERARAVRAVGAVELSRAPAAPRHGRDCHRPPRRAAAFGRSWRWRLWRAEVASRPEALPRRLHADGRRLSTAHSQQWGLRRRRAGRVQP